MNYKYFIIPVVFINHETCTQVDYLKNDTCIQGNTPGSMEADGGKVSEGKEKLPIKRSKGSLGSLNMITGKTNEASKPSGAATNGGYSKRYSLLSGDLCFTILSSNIL